MAGRKNGSFGGNGQGADGEVLKFLAALVKGQARMAADIVRLRRDLHSMSADFNRGFRTLFKVTMDSHKDIQGLKADVSVLKADVSVLKADVGDLKGRMTGVERRFDGNGHPPAPPRPNGR